MTLAEKHKIKAEEKKLEKEEARAKFRLNQIKPTTNACFNILFVLLSFVCLFPVFYVFMISVSSTDSITKYGYVALFPDDTDIQEVRNGLPQPAGAGARPDDSASGDDTHARLGIALSRHGPAAASDKQGRLVARLHPHGIGDDTRRQPTDFGKDARQPERRVAVRERDGRKATGRHSPQPIAIHSRPARKGTERTKQDKRHRQWRTAN